MLNAYPQTPTRLHCIRKAQLNITAFFLLGKWKQGYGAPSPTTLIIHYLASLYMFT